MKLLLAFTLLFSSVLLANFNQTRIVIDHNANEVANQGFKFKNVPSPVKDDAAAKA